MTDRVLSAFLARQQKEGLALAGDSDLLQLFPLGNSADRYIAQFTCAGLVQRQPNQIVKSHLFDVGIWFPSNYLRDADPFRVITWLGPRNIWHPNISDAAPLMCIGRLTPGTGLVDILYQVFEIITWNKVTMREDDALNRAACQWARQHQDRIPVDRRPLKRRSGNLRITDVSEQGEVNGRAQ